MKKALPIIIVIIVIAGFGVAWKLTKKEAPFLVTNFEECVKAGNPVMESYPRQCRHGDQTFTEDIGNELEKKDLIRIDSPRPNRVIQSPLTITGEARGSWFFEASFPVVLANWDGLIIAQGIATAKSDWMTSEFVPFEARLVFTVDKNAYSNKGTLILRKDNPSGFPEHDDALEIPVVLAGVTPPSPKACTQEAKLCPDGSAVGRTGPNCEFTPCPDETTTGLVKGKVTVGPTCPVERIPPDPACADKPYKTTIQIIAVGSPKSSPFAVAESDDKGLFEAILPPGEYAIQPIGGSPLPHCETKNITIEPNTMIDIILSCDTGIR